MTDAERKALVARVEAARTAMLAAEVDVRLRRGEYHASIARLSHGGLTVREIGKLLGMSHQRVQQILSDLACSFCRRSADEVAKLIAGAGRQPTWRPGRTRLEPVVYICDRCAGRAAAAVRTRAPVVEDEVVMSLAGRGSDAPCEFCGCKLGDRNGVKRVDAIATHGGAHICRACIRVATDILESDWKQEKKAIR